MWTGYSCLRTVFSSGLLQSRKWTFGFQTAGESVEQLSDYQILDVAVSCGVSYAILNRYAFCTLTDMLLMLYRW